MLNKKCQMKKNKVIINEIDNKIEEETGVENPFYSNLVRSEYKNKKIVFFEMKTLLKKVDVLVFQEVMTNYGNCGIRISLTIL